ncbi:MAG: polyphenol oxidase family protein [Acidimicrobiia bacterium]
MIGGQRGRARWWFTDRQGGSSLAPFASNNLGDHVGDDPEAVHANRDRLARTLGLPAPELWVWLRQVHGATVLDRTGTDPRSSSLDPPPEADAAVTTRSGLPLVVCTADCAPLLLVGDDAIGVVHAGWRGLVAGVIDETVALLRKCGADAIHAVLGPCISPAHYTFGDAQLREIAAQFGDSVVGTTDDGAPALNLPVGVQLACASAGVESFSATPICTYASADHFSYRRDGTTGRQALIAVLT